MNGFRRGWQWAGMTILAAGLLLALQFASSAGQQKPPEAAADTRSLAHENLHAVLWVQRSAEYLAASQQAYRGARRAMDQALDDPTRSAALEQSPGSQSLPPAIILDVDDTVLDNSYYEARMIRDGGSYGPETWDPWVEEAAAPAIPGAREFCRYAETRGVTVFYLTNRRDHLRAATRENLRRRGFPLRTDREVVLTRTAERDKGPRRAAVCAEFRVLLLVGDNAGDFASGFDATDPALRETVYLTHAERWGEQWILLPNPMYGAWESALLDGNFQRPADEIIARKRAALRYDPATSSSRVSF